jgi:NAD(P)-dependent dehydrogenase (short-subunit alcohol dehydrogenase family)
MQLMGKAALISGAGGGICRAIAVAFAEAGAAVACCDIDPEAAAETAQQVTAAGGRAVASLRRRERSRHPGRRRRGL